MKRILAALAIILGATLTVAGCSGTEPMQLGEEAVIIDVRTPDEYAAGHLEGAINIDVQSANFDGLVMTQPLDGEYVLYCRTGNRSAQATSRMQAMGFTDVTDAGTVQNASSATGIPIVQ